MTRLISIVHDEPEPDCDRFIDDVASWILKRSVDPVAEGGKAKL